MKIRSQESEIRSQGDPADPRHSAGGAASCDYCGLPINEARGDDQPRYCCYGCRFAASITAASGDEGQARFAMMRLGLAVFFAMNVMVFTMLLWSQPAQISELAAAWYGLARYACLLFTLPVVFLLGGPILKDAISEIRRGRPSLSLLLSVGVAASLLYSAWSLWSGGHVYFEVAAVILVAVTLGRWFEASGKLKTTEALRSLKRLLPDQVRLVLGPHEEIVSAAKLTAGDIYRVLPGGRIVADGQVVRYAAAVDEQAVTGESLPVVRQQGDRVMSGTLVLDGPLEIRASAVAGEGTLARMIRAVTEATASRSHHERLAEQISRWFLPAIAVVALITFGVHASLESLAAGILSALSVLVIACPCALGLATPMALWAAVGRAAQGGVLLRDGDALSLLANAKTICLDKTGTLTTGEAAVETLELVLGCDRDEVLAVAQALTRSSNHPLSIAVNRYAAEFASGARGFDAKGLAIHPDISSPLAPDSLALPATETFFHSLSAHNIVVQAGRGIAADIDSLGATVYFGSRAWMVESRQGLSEPLLDSGDDSAAEAFVGWNGQIYGRFTFRESVRPEAEGTIALLKRAGIRTIMLSGDRQPRASALAESLDLEFQSELLPEEKLAAIEKLRERGPVVMVGDGINDAPALAAADVGISLGSGTDISRHSAGVCLLSNDLLRLPWLVLLARQTERTIRWNLFWAFAYNVLGIGLAAAGYLHPIAAAIAMGASSLLVVTNSLALARFELNGSAGGRP